MLNKTNMLNKVLLFSVLLVATLIVATVIAILVLTRQPIPASQAIINANIITLDKKNQVAQAMLIHKNRIVQVGSNQQIKAKIQSDTVIHDLQGKTVVPGFIDAHGHFPGSALATLNVDLNSPPIGTIKSIDELLTALKNKASNTSTNHWILGVGYDDTLLAEKRHPTRKELDLAVPDHPVFLWHVSGHMGVANSAALKIAEIEEQSEPPEGGAYVRDPISGKLNGLLEETAITDIQMMAMDFSIMNFFRMIKSASYDYAKVGVTTAQSGAVTYEIAQGLYFGSRLGLIPMRLELWPLFDELGPQLLDGSVAKNSFQSDKVNLGAIKMMADGSIQGYTGYLSQPYHVPPAHSSDRTSEQASDRTSDPASDQATPGTENEYRGYPRVPKDELIDWVDKYHRAGFQLAIHGNGDASIDDILSAIELAQMKTPRDDTRHIIVHAQMARPDQLDKMNHLGVTPSFFVAHTYYWGDRHRDIFIGPERTARISPTATAMNKNVRFSLHLDTPVVPMDPLFLLWTATQRLSSSGQSIGPDERINPLAALRAITIDAAWQIHQEDNRGSLEVGKYADLVVLSQDLLQFPELLKDIEVELTMVGGQTIYPKKRS
jgi:predicted amidohydrolase YtcJ